VRVPSILRVAQNHQRQTTSLILRKDNGISKTQENQQKKKPAHEGNLDHERGPLLCGPLLCESE